MTRIAGLDLLRGFAIALVMIRHAWPDVMGSSGTIGVVMFFALSGYLITGVLVYDIKRFSKIRYKRFYRNRALRLLPALLFFLLGLTFITLVFDPVGDRPGLLRSVIIGVTYTANIPIDHGTAAIDHLWTLATEEQFYIIWPVILAVGLRTKRVRLVLIVSAAAIIGVLIASMILAAPDVSRVQGLPSSWALAMLIGASARLGEPRISSALARSPIPTGALAAVAFGAIAVLLFVPEDKNSPLTYLVLGPLVSALTVIVIFHVRNWVSLPTQWLRPLLLLGTISYAAYIWNYAIVIWMGGMEMSLADGALSILFTVSAAIASWFLVEKPTAAWKNQIERRDRLGADAARSTHTTALVASTHNASPDQIGCLNVASKIVPPASTKVADARL
nr:acyltransferase [Cryobacterium sp. Y29]